MTLIDRRGFWQATAAAALCGGLARGAADDKKSKPAFQLGMVTYNTGAKWDLPTLLQVCKNAGIAAVELRTTHAHGVEPTLTKQQRQDVRKRFADSGVVCWGCGSTCEFHSPSAAEVKKQIDTCKRFVDLVADIGGKGVKVRPNTLPKDVPVEKTLEQIGKSLIPCGQAAAERGVEIWVEVHGRGTSEPPHVKTFMDHCGHKSVGITWNSNKADIKNGSVAEYFKLLRPYLKSCHINNLYWQHTGGYPYRELFRLLQESGYDRYTLYEGGRPSTDARLGEELLRYYKSTWQELAGA